MKGINGPMLHQFIDDVLAQAVNWSTIEDESHRISTESFHTNLDAIRQAFHDRGCSSPQSSSCLRMMRSVSLRSTTRFHDWKEDSTLSKSRNC
jgi:hypothetical protein